jgi:hypothetical protein
MENKEQQIISEIVKIISQTSITALTEENIKYPNKEDYIQSFLGVTNNELEKITEFVVQFLPQRIYLNKYETVKNYIIGMISQELILFLAQEDINSEQFADNIKSFRDEVVNEIVNNIYVLGEGGNE